MCCCMPVYVQALMNLFCFILSVCSDTAHFKGNELTTNHTVFTPLGTRASIFSINTIVLLYVYFIQHNVSVCSVFLTAYISCSTEVINAVFIILKYSIVYSNVVKCRLGQLSMCWPKNSLLQWTRIILLGYCIF